LSLLLMAGFETQHQTPAPAPVLAAPIHIPQTTPVAAAAAGFNKPVQPAAAFKPPPPAVPTTSICMFDIPT
jgi:hypothetical protein